MKKKITLAVILLLLIAVIVVAVVYFTGHQKLDWELYGAVISEDGEIEQTFQFTFSSWLKTRFSSNSSGGVREADCVKITTDWPDGFLFSDEENREYAIQPYPDESLSRYLCSGYIFTGQKYDPIQLEIYLEKQFVVYSGDALDGRYIVASTDPNADLLQLLKDSGLLKST